MQNEVPQKILIIDDEESICRTLTAIFKDEGFAPISAQDGETGLQLIREASPALVLLDIWMPSMDGIEVLQKIKEIDHAIPVVMISGHATISTALQATRMGAADFIEKPLELEATMRVVRRVLGMTDLENEVEAGQVSEEKATAEWVINGGSEGVAINRVVFEDQRWRGRKVTQKTLKHSAILYGHGVHSGKKSGLLLEPLGANCGIHFTAVASTQAVPAHLNYVHSTGYATTIREGENSVATVEHLMSALHAYGITNLLIKCNGEVPVMDGSALEFSNLFDQVGLEEQVGDFYEIEVKHAVRIGNETEYILLEPADEFSIEYTLQYPEPIGRQYMQFTLESPATFVDFVAPARTFGFVRDIGALQKQGLAQGGRFDNFVLVGEDGIINADLRYPDEPVRHKILDMIGDLYLLGRPIRGKITACMTGHSDNIALLRALQKEMNK